MPVIPVTWEAGAGGSRVQGQRHAPGFNPQNKDKKKKSLARWRVPIVPATSEAEAVGSLDPRSLKPWGGWWLQALSPSPCGTA
uniref:Uncharacterized protein n=1 Tax=Sciurus vulgaris TaxID=55149 RepID=A0A8D2D6L5_SCIVU